MDDAYRLTRQRGGAGVGLFQEGSTNVLCKSPVAGGGRAGVRPREEIGWVRVGASAGLWLRPDLAEPYGPS